MSDIIANKYVSALKSVSEKFLMDTHEKLSGIVGAYNVDKFNDILISTDISKEQKVELIVELAKISDPKMVNFIKLLGEHKRLGLIPTIFKLIDSEVSIINNEYKGSVSSKTGLSDKTISELGSALSKKVGKNVTLSSQESESEMVKTVVDDLNLEISFSKEIFKTQLKKHILKAI